jgi:protein dispatched 1
MNDIASPGHNDKVNTYYFMGVLILEVLLDIVIRDALMAIASFVFVFLYLRLTVGSWFLAIIGMTEIIMSVPVSWFLYKTVLRIEYFAFLNVLTLYIVAAIGADDIFIFMDAYKQSAHSDDPEVLEDLESRMSWVYRRTGSAMFITSATTCAAFLCTLITPLVDIRSFGIFAAIVIFMDYVLVMTLFCTAVVIYHNKFERPGCCFSCCNGCRTIDPSSTTTARANIGNHDEEQMDRVSRFFRNSVAPFVGAPMSRIVMAILFVAWIAVACSKYRR